MSASSAREWLATADGVALACQWRGRVPYAEALSLMGRLWEERRRGRRPDTALFLEHPPVLTVGRGCARDDLLASPAELRRLGVEVHDSDRGGRITYHGPGQLVAYPILGLGRSPVTAARYARALGDAMVALCGRLGLEAHWDEARPGVWVGEQKLGAVGVRVADGVSRHGFALNVATDLSHYGLLVPCGLRDAGVGSVLSLGGVAPPLEAVALLAGECLVEALAAARVRGEPPCPARP